MIYPKYYKPDDEDKNLKVILQKANTPEELFEKTIILKESLGWHEPEVLEKLFIDEAESITYSKTKAGVDKYPIDLRSNIDLLIFVESSPDEKKFTGGFRAELIENKLSAFGWRSISCHCGGLSRVLYCNKTAPDKLKQILHTKVKV